MPCIEPIRRPISSSERSGSWTFSSPRAMRSAALTAASTGPVSDRSAYIASASSPPTATIVMAMTHHRVVRCSASAAAKAWSTRSASAAAPWSSMARTATYCSCIWPIAAPMSSPDSPAMRRTLVPRASTK